MRQTAWVHDPSPDAREVAGSRGATGSNPPLVRRSIVIPMFDEATRIGPTIEALAASPLHDATTEFVLVDDGSSDGTVAVAEAAIGRTALPARVLRLPENRGKGAAVQAGMQAARGAVVAFSDADLSAPPVAIESCLAAVEAGADVAVATRLHEASEIKAEPPLLRRLSGKTFVLFLHALGLTDLVDTQCGLKAFRRDAAEDLFGDLMIEGFAFDVELLVRARRLRLEVVEVPIEWAHVEASRVRPVRDGGRMLLDVVRLRATLGRGGRSGAGPDAAGDDGGGAGAEEPPASMDESRFRVMAELENDHWWFAAKRALVRAEVSRLAPPKGAALDIGCGTGAMVTDLGRMGFDPVVGTDLSRVALVHAARNGVGGELLSSYAEQLPFADAAFSCVTSLDVIEHLDDDERALREYLRVVVPGGAVAIAVPAYQWAWSDHDTALGHRRRYTATRLQRVAERAGLEVERCSYFHSWLVPPALVLRKTPIGRLVRSTQEEASFVSPEVNRLLGTVTAVERRVLGRRRLPVGLSILLVGRRPEVPATVVPVPAVGAHESVSA